MLKLLDFSGYAIIIIVIGTQSIFLTELALSSMKENLFTPSKLVKNKMIDTLKLDNVMKKTLD